MVYRNIWIWLLLGCRFTFIFFDTDNNPNRCPREHNKTTSGHPSLPFRCLHMTQQALYMHITWHGYSISLFLVTTILVNAAVPDSFHGGALCSALCVALPLIAPSLIVLCLVYTLHAPSPHWFSHCLSLHTDHSDSDGRAPLAHWESPILDSFSTSLIWKSGFLKRWTLPKSRWRSAIPTSFFLFSLLFLHREQHWKVRLLGLKSAILYHWRLLISHVQVHNLFLFEGQLLGNVGAY